MTYRCPLTILNNVQPQEGSFLTHQRLNLKDKVFQNALESIKMKTTDAEQGLNVILIARNLERIGDHATNIAEDVIFSISGKDVRHSHSREKGGLNEK